MSTRFLLWFGWIKWARERASERGEARFMPYLSAFQSTPVLLLDGWICCSADGLWHDSPTKTVMSVDRPMYSRVLSSLDATEIFCTT